MPKLTSISERVAARFWSYVNKDGPIPVDAPHLGPCWLWTGGTYHFGHGKFSIRRDTHVASRVSFFIANGFEAFPECLHSCDVPGCVNPAHLRAGTQQDNIRDRDSRGRVSRGDNHYTRKSPHLAVRGERQGSAKLTEEKVRAIRAEYATGRIIYDILGPKYGVSRAVACSVVTRRTWKHVV